MSVRVGVVGLGRMGAPMAARLATAGHELAVWNRTSGKAETFAADHAGHAQVEVSGSPALLAARSDVVVSMLADDRAIADVYEGPDGLVAGLAPGAVVLEMSTIGPEMVARLVGLLAKCDARLVDAPVSGSVALAEAGELTIMVGGERADIAKVEPVLHCLGNRILPMGPVGSGAAMKLAVNTVILGLNQAVSEGLVLAEAAGIDRLAAYNVFASSAVAAPFVQYRRKAFEHPDEVPPAFALSLAGKDLDLILELARVTGATLPQTETNRRVIAEADDAGYGAHDVSGTAAYLRTLVGDSTTRMIDRDQQGA